jgi:hypothetical protein
MRALWAVDVACSDPACTEESEVILAELDDAEWVVCECGHTMVAIAIAEFEPAFATRR